MRRLATAIGLCLLACAPARAQQAVDDPTRPPAILTAPAAPAGGAARAAGLPELQSILVSQRAGGRRLAVIDGKTLRQGERVGGAVIEAIRPTEVVLLNGNKRVILKLFRPLASGAPD